MSDDDILALAQRIVRGSYINFSSRDHFVDTSSIYRFTNEDITSYFHHLQNKRRVLSVIGSGNQILNSILGGSRVLDCFDISVFPERYLFLQIASVIALSKEDYINYLLSSDRDMLFSDNLYKLISSKLCGKYKRFWDNLYMFDDGIDIYESLLFRQDFYDKDIVIERNPYLQDNNYEKLKNILKMESIEINTFVTNILNAKFNEEYDLINLSNILAYYLSKEDYLKYFENKFKLSSGGEIINYIYDMSEKNVDYFNRVLDNFGYVEKIGNNKLLVYKRF